MFTVTAEQAQQIETALMKIADLRNLGKIQPEVIAFETLYIIRAAKAHANARSSIRSTSEYSEQAEQEPLDDDARDNMLLWMIQRHFPSLPLSDEHTDWGRWLGFANAAFEAGRKDAAPVRTKDLTDDEVAKAYMECTGGDIIARCRAVIALDREKNK